MEDVDYLTTYSEKDTITFFIDSSSRDMARNPEPNPFTLNFTEPIKNVYGVEILDATIPVTMWSIDKYNDVFAYSYIFYFNNENATTFQQYFKELENDKTFVVVFESLGRANLFICLEEANFNSIADSGLQYSQHVVFYRHKILVDSKDVQVASETDSDPDFVVFYNPNDSKYYRVSNPSTELFAVIQENEFYLLPDLSAFVVYRHKYLTRQQALDMIESHTIFDIYINNEYTTIERGFYNSVNFVKYMTSFFEDSRGGTPFPQDSFSLQPDFISISQANAYGGLEKQMKLVFSFPSHNSFLFDMKKSTCGNTMGFYGNNNLSISSKRNPKLYLSKYDVTQDAQYLYAPGVINLQGLNYILLRIPEIDSHLLKSHGFSDYNPGIGMFKLTAPNEVVNLRFDFVNLVRKPFHPIGKLSSITVIFVTNTGELYDFKGIDYNMLLAIKLYAPPKNKINPSQINPSQIAPSQINPSRVRPKKEYEIKKVLYEQNKYSDESNIREFHG